MRDEDQQIIKFNYGWTHNYFCTRSWRQKIHKKKYLSNYAITGLYFFDNKVIDFTKKLKPSKRGELEIIDLLNIYKKRKILNAEFIGRGGAWLDTGNINDFYNASNFISAIENRQGLKVACLEEISLKQKFITKSTYAHSCRNRWNSWNWHYFYFSY